MKVVVKISTVNQPLLLQNLVRRFASDEFKSLSTGALEEDGGGLKARR
jgi:hypothetical protein